MINVGIDTYSRLRCNQSRSPPDRQHPTDTVYVCICNGVTDHQIREAAENGCASLAELTMRTGCGSNCGSCLEMAGDLLSQAHASRALPLPMLGFASAA